MGNYTFFGSKKKEPTIIEGTHTTSRLELLNIMKFLFICFLGKDTKGGFKPPAKLWLTSLKNDLHQTSNPIAKMDFSYGAYLKINNNSMQSKREYNVSHKSLLYVIPQNF